MLLRVGGSSEKPSVRDLPNCQACGSDTLWKALEDKQPERLNPSHGWHARSIRAAFLLPVGFTLTRDRRREICATCLRHMLERGLREVPRVLRINDRR